MVVGTGAYLVTVLTGDGDKYTFDGHTPLRIVSGTAIPEARITNNANPLQNYSYVEYRSFAPRKIAAVVQIAGGSNKTVWAVRQKLIRLFNPLRGPFTFILSYPNKNEIYYAYNVMLTDAMDCPLDTKGDARYAEFPLALTAFDPFWYGASHRLIYSTGTTDVPVVVGTALIKPVITITGPITDPGITNTIWSGVAPFKLQVLGAIANGDSVIIDTKNRMVTRTSGAGVALSSDSTMNSFGFIPEQLGALGINTIVLSATVPGVGFEFQIDWQDTYYAL